MNNYVYLLKCRNNSYYCGWTNNLEKRIQAHQSGQGAKYTKAFGPIELVYYEVFDSKQAAMKREYAIKQMSHKEKTDLIQSFQIQDMNLDKMDHEA